MALSQGWRVGKFNTGLDAGSLPSDCAQKSSSLESPSWSDQCVDIQPPQNIKISFFSATVDLVSSEAVNAGHYRRMLRVGLAKCIREDGREQDETGRPLPATPTTPSHGSFLKLERF